MIVKEETVQELLKGYQWDLECRATKTEDELKAYSACVASSVGEMCTRAMMYHEGKEALDVLIRYARQIGFVLQYVNIVHDIVTDSVGLGRLREETRILGDKGLKELSTKLIVQANEMMRLA
ncbi:hypothetical protein CU098_006574, partial [Rhizopus stolonifer]